MTICWHDTANRCHQFHDGAMLLGYGRCRSGKRWFWAARDWDGETRHGWADAEEDALGAARAVVTDLAAGRPALAWRRESVATGVLKELNAAKRRARPPSAETGSAPAGYLYGTVCYWPDQGPGVRKVVPFRITRKTAKRVYYVRAERGQDVVTGYVDRQALERDGEAWNRGVHWSADDSRLYATRAAAEGALGLDQKPAGPPDLKALRQAMADAHPDRGGTDAEFIAARERYERALRRAS
jgi:hypothetical protein